VNERFFPRADRRRGRRGVRGGARRGGPRARQRRSTSTSISVRSVSGASRAATVARPRARSVAPGLRRTNPVVYRRSGNRRRRGGRGVARRGPFVLREPGTAEKNGEQGGGGRSRSRPTRRASPASGAPTPAPRMETSASPQSRALLGADRWLRESRVRSADAGATRMV